MRIYASIVMALSSFTLFCCLIFLIFSLKDYNFPMSELSGDAYKEFVNIEFFKQKELKRSESKDSLNSSGTIITTEEWQHKWEASKNLSIEQIKFKSKNDAMSAGIWIFAMSLLCYLHLYLFKKSKPITITI